MEKQQVTKGSEIFIEIGRNDKTIGLLVPTYHSMEGKEECEG
jgi:hypothetical protein